MLLLLRGATHGDVVGESHQVGQKHEERGVVTLTAASFFIHKSRGLSSLTCFFQEPSLRVLHCHSWDKDILNHIAHVYIHARCIFSKRYIHISFMEAHSMGDTFACCIVSCTYVHRTEAIPWHPWHPLQQLWGFAMPIQVDANNFSVVLLVFFVKLGYQTIKNLGGNQHLLFKLRYPPPKLNSSPIGKDRLPTTILQGLCYETSGGYIPPNHLPQLRQLGLPFFMEVDEDFERDVTNAVAQFLQAYWDS